MRVFAALDDTFGEKKRRECPGKTRELFVLQRLYSLFFGPGLMSALVLGVISFAVGSCYVKLICTEGGPITLSPTFRTTRKKAV
jgi:hypothetical protein